MKYGFAQESRLHRRLALIKKNLLLPVAALMVAFVANAQTAQQPPYKALPYPPTVHDMTPARSYQAPQGISYRADDFYSDNVRLSAQWFYATENAGKKLPTVVMAHGWGGVAARFRKDAIDLARAGYLVLIFDYRGWGDSDGRVVRTGKRSETANRGEPETAQIKELRGYVDPIEQTEDWFNAINYAVTQPMVDTDHIGIRGSSYSGGFVIYVAARDARVKAIVSQVGAFDGRPRMPYRTPAEVEKANENASLLATGRAAYPGEGLQTRAMEGAPVGNKYLRWAPIFDADRITQPTLFIVAEKEDMFSNEDSGVLACNRVKGPRKLLVIPGHSHYGVYADGVREPAIEEAIKWFDRYLKAGDSSARSTAALGESERGECRVETAVRMKVPPPPKAN
jgi:dienelactone hydrolase